MKGSVLIDSNLAVLLIVGNASRSYVSIHKRCRGFTLEDFDLLGEIIKEFDDIITIPHVLAETANLTRQIPAPAYRPIQAAFRAFVEGLVELPIASQTGCQRQEFERLGLTDAVLLRVCDLDIDNTRPTLLTADSDLADRALSLNYSVIDYKREYMSG